MATNWAPVGEQLAKLQTAPQAAYETRLGQLVQRGRSEQGLAQDILKTEALQGVEDALIASGSTPAQARLGALAARGSFGSDLASVGQHALRQQELENRRQAVDAYGTGGIDAANQYLIGIASGPQDATKITSGQAYNPLVTPGKQTIQITDVGQAAIGADRALATAREASADASAALADKRRMPSLGTQATGGAKGTYNAPSNASLRRAFGTDDGGINAGQVAAFQQWRAQHPEFRSGEEALVNYLATKNLPPPMEPDGITGADPFEDDPADVGDIGPREDTYFVGPDGQQRRLGDVARTPATRAYSESEVLQAIRDGREAVRRGKLTREQVQKRLRDAGLGNAAEQI